jgi:hypothetical protein
MQPHGRGRYRGVYADYGSYPHSVTRVTPCPTWDTMAKSTGAQNSDDGFGFSHAGLPSGVRRSKPVVE